MYSADDGDVQETVVPAGDTLPIVGPIISLPLAHLRDCEFHGTSPLFDGSWGRLRSRHCDNGQWEATGTAVFDRMAASTTAPHSVRDRTMAADRMVAVSFLAGHPPHPRHAEGR